MWWLAASCALELDPPTETAFVVYDPATGRIPVPNDLARDEEIGRLALPIAADAGPAEAAFRAALNEQDGWSSASTITFALSAPVDPVTVSAETVQLWAWGAEPTRLELPIEVAEDGRSLTIDPPETGWEPGGRYVVLAVGGPRGLHSADGLPVGPDAAFFYLRSPVSLLGHDHAFPGATREERQATAEQLEGIRSSLQPYVEHAVGTGVAREDLAALWTFTVTRRPELAMDAVSQRMPLPFDLLIDPATGYVALPPHPDDDALEQDAKAVANTLRGFAISADLTFEATLPLDPATVDADTVELWDLTAAPTRVPAAVRAWSEDGPCVPGDDGCIHVVVDPEPMPLTPGTTYAVLVRDGITDRAGEPLAPMAVGHLLMLNDPIAEGGRTTVAEVPDAEAARVEGVRARVDLLLDSVGRDGVVTAWPFTTLDPTDDLRAVVQIPAELGYDPTPRVTNERPPVDLLGDDPLSDLLPGILNPAEPLYLGRIDGVATVVEGTIPAPDHLDPVTRRWVEPGSMHDLHFMATVPDRPGTEPLPVVIFGHALVTDRRFVLTVSGELAKKGFVAVSVDFPYHGERVACIGTSLMAIPNFLPEPLQSSGPEDDLLHVWPCASGDRATCSPDGQCLGPNGQPEPFATLPIVDIQPAAGAAMLDVADLPHIPDHFRQALIDLGALRYSLQTADWERALGHPIRTDRFLYAGQSLGGIIGSVYAAVDPTITRAVFNVPGADMVDLFEDSTYFSPQMDAYVQSLEVPLGSYEHERLLNVAHWLVDSVDPHSVGHVYREESARIEALIQIDRIDENLGDIVIPNATSDVLQQASGLPMIEYPSVLHGDLVIPVIGDAMLADLADFLAEGP